MQFCRIIFSIFLLLSPCIVDAREENDPIGWFDPRPEQGKHTTWIYGQDVVITGANLHGKYSVQDGFPSDRELCFSHETYSNDIVCFKSTDPLIKVWSANMVVMSIPEHAPPRGTVKLRYTVKKEECKSLLGLGAVGFGCVKAWKWGDDVVVGSYRLSPQVKRVTKQNTEKEVKGFVAGGVYEIRGHWFGGEKGHVRIGGKMIFPSDIMQWQPDRIVIRPSVGGSGVQIYNGFAYSDAIVGGLPPRRSYGVGITSKIPRSPVRWNASLLGRPR